MANYSTHKNIGIISITISSIVIYKLNEKLMFFNTNFESISLFILFGLIGSLLPDIDLNKSKPTKIVRALLILSFTILYVFNLQYIHSKTNIDKNIIIIFLFFIPYLLTQLILSFIHSLTYHRGIIHSVPFALLSSYFILYILSFVNIQHFNIDGRLVSLGFFIGFLTHLFLDEFYSVDFYNKKIKKSIGTAFSFYSKKNPFGYILMYLMIIVILYNKFPNLFIF